MIIKDVLADAQKKLAKLISAEPELEAEILLSKILSKKREYLLANPNKKISFGQNFNFQRLIKKRLAGYSAAVLTGHKWFYGLDFIVNKNVLIPRPETELMVDEALEKVKSEKLKVKSFKIIDLGTGSGCIVISLAKFLKETSVNFYGLDISRKALAVAKTNAIKNGVGDKIKFIKSDLLNSIDKNIFNEPTIITANLPYLTPEQVNNSPSIQKEPRLALLAGADGLDCYRRLFAQIKNREIKNELIIFCEIDETQKDLMAELIKQNFPQAEFEFKNDLGGHCRLAIIKFK
jgi:release factor glutamine methyltransferase